MSTRAACPQPPAGYSTNFRAGVSPRCFATGSQGAQLAADGNNSTPVVTELYLAELYIPCPVRLTGIAPFNGSDVTNNVRVGLYDSSGNIMASSGDVAGSGADAYQLVPFAYQFDSSQTQSTFTQLFVDPGTYYVALHFDGTTTRFNTFAVGSFGAGRITGVTSATAMISTSLTLTPPVTFTTAYGPLASVY